MPSASRRPHKCNRIAEGDAESPDVDFDPGVEDDVDKGGCDFLTLMKGSADFSICRQRKLAFSMCSSGLVVSTTDKYTYERGGVNLVM